MRHRFKLIILLAGLLIMFLTAAIILEPEQDKFNQICSYLAYPVVLFNHKVITFIEQQNWRLSDRDLVVNNQRLQDTIIDLQSQNIALLAQKNYWQEHQELIEFNKRYNFDDAILTQIFFKNLKSQVHYALLDKGECDGVRRDMVAIYQNCLLGKVVEVYPKYCKLLLLTDRNCKIAVYDEQTGAVGICCGQNDLNQVVLSYVSHLQKINLNDLLISSGDGEVFPKGFAIGKISDLNVAGMYYEAHADLLIDLQELKSCYLVAANKS